MDLTELTPQTLNWMCGNWRLRYVDPSQARPISDAARLLYAAMSEEVQDVEEAITQAYQTREVNGCEARWNVTHRIPTAQYAMYPYTGGQWWEDPEVNEWFVTFDQAKDFLAAQPAVPNEQQRVAAAQAAEAIRLAAEQPR